VIVVRVTRRQALVRTNDGEVIEGILKTKFLDTVVGDLVTLNEERVIIARSERRNLLRRSLDEKQKNLVANLDLLLVITAPPPLLNTKVIDRMLTGARAEGIQTALVFNKSDLGKFDTKGYEHEKIFEISAKFEKGLSELFEFISPYHHVALCGVSGVGKSTILKKLVPSAQAKINEVSEKTGQGRQTTSEAIGYTRNESQLITDLPGVQSFGLSHLTPDLLRESFPEFSGIQCKFRDCSHRAEPGCSVKSAVDEGKIARFRYDSYLEILTELEQSLPY
jgi:ribosome biogenesis GTPase